ncbi:MAG: WG repeat-containing protein [Bacteroidota bacterium]
MQHRLFFVLSFILLSQLTNAQVNTHDHAHNIESRNDKLYGEHSKEPVRLMNGFFKVFVNNKWSLLDSKKNPVSDILYEDIADYSYGLLPVMLNKKWGFLGEKGNQVFPCKFSNIGYFTENVAAATIDNRWVLINNTGRIVKELDIDFFYGFKSKKAKIIKGNKVAWINLNGDIIPPGWTEESSKNISTLRTNGTTSGVASSYCPPNITFENGDFTNWQCFSGSVYAANSNSCVCYDIYGSTIGLPLNTNADRSCSPSCNNILRMYSSTPIPPDPNRHLIIPKSTQLDPYGGFPITPPDGSNFAVKLGNENNYPLAGGLQNSPNSQSERIRYKITIPNPSSEFFIIFHTP